ncbi:hypothetical protein SSPO_010210 [Streptomyces antimycoticus]|uniref:Uncharacterized protein n=1 Tax=Streptomyces antimycoticus TaxID=68175 RepID=A0A499UBR2_9ACTN|nr:hypothetical protein [Streptomyces antimycoticus]BBJ38303.1 hypothetical protein SSPO_010210 [Streptomyces antimycoticus]
MPAASLVMGGGEPEHAGPASDLLQTVQQLGRRHRTRRHRLGLRRRVHTRAVASEQEVLPTQGLLALL